MYHSLSNAIRRENYGGLERFACTRKDRRCQGIGKVSGAILQTFEAIFRAQDYLGLDNTSESKDGGAHQCQQVRVLQMHVKVCKSRNGVDMGRDEIGSTLEKRIVSAFVILVLVLMKVLCFL